MVSSCGRVWVDRFIGTDQRARTSWFSKGRILGFCFGHFNGQDLVSDTGFGYGSGYGFSDYWILVRIRTLDFGTG